MVKFSLCMIVKNEETILSRCLDSVVDLMDEVIIVDTGSTDQTKEIAYKYTDKVFDFDWIDDFSAARNFSFKKATGDYIYMADADEVIDEENRKRFREMKQVLLPEIDIVQMKYCNQLEHGTAYNFDEEYRPKLFRRLREFTWIEPIHETVRLEPVVYDSDISIMHLPENCHTGRDLATFRKHIGKGLRLSKRLHHMYAMELFISGTDEDFLLAEPYFNQSAEDTDRSMDEIREAACIVTHAARVRGETATILKMCLKDMVNEGSSEMCYELGEFFFGRGDYKEAILWFFNAATQTESILNIHTSKDWPWKRLAECEDKLGNKEAAKEYQEKYIARSKA